MHIMLYILRQMYYGYRSIACRSNYHLFNIYYQVNQHLQLIRREEYAWLASAATLYEATTIQLSCIFCLISHEKYIVKETTLYSAFTRMEKNGYITSFPGVGENGGKKRTYYQITDEGRLYYQSKCEEWALTKEVIEKFIVKEN